jgi:hypothetical protein
MMARAKDFLLFLIEETLALLALGAFLATIAAWSAIFIWGI